MTTLSDSKILVIGASSGVGRATAVSLVALGAKVVAAARHRERLDELRAAAAGALETRTLDATDGAALSRVLAEVRPDHVVLSAGSHSRLALVDEHDWESFSLPWNQDVKMAFELGRAALALPLRRGSTVVIVSSGAGLGGSPLSGGYAGAKRMQMFLASYLARASQERSLGLRFVSVVPKQLLVGTETAHQVSRAYAKLAGITPEKFMERFEQPLDAQAVASAITSVLEGKLAPESATLVVTGKGTELL
ncbi:MAG TPA: SDR family oxidoreductase [Polyangiaceae bacterium]|jgi:NADP-dependent 3-hydroxy acid dehydrogenase YdfG|nr:SDR family oxidoreductase [Polyangiaceae bacterium]